MKWMHRLLGIVFGLSIFFALFVLSFETMIFNESFFRWHYKEHEVMDETGMALSDLMDVTVVMLDYLKDKRDNLDMQATIDGQYEEVFGQREKDHMIDVKDLYLNAQMIRRIATMFIFLIALYGYIRQPEALKRWLKHMKWVFASIGSVTLILGVLFALQFEKYFTKFHEIFFDNDLWLLDPATDIMIHIVPEIYFYLLVMLSVILFMIQIGVAIFIAEILRRKIKVGVSK